MRRCNAASSRLAGAPWLLRNTASPQPQHLQDLAPGNAEGLVAALPHEDAARRTGTSSRFRVSPYVLTQWDARSPCLLDVNKRESATGMVSIRSTWISANVRTPPR
ncbi:hypothetical protein ILUMI_01891 [Ignelater luminosus]|uniref:Uncharacterized protein n=1 Tax=Ignelater luminosus TaxID=2038154 RepID=A0A8K0GNR6_IGNLU|nr:hypothetical protein ILUMI_01891 [Ignelater luminosus]